MTSLSKNAQCDVFGNLTHSKIFITFEGGKNARPGFFNALALCILNNFSNKFWANIYMPPLLLFFKTCRIGIHFSFILFFILLNSDQHSTFFPKKNLFRKIHKTYFLKQNAYLHTIQKRKKSEQFYLKAEGDKISKHPGLIPWPNNFSKKLFKRLRKCSFTAHKCPLYSPSGHKTMLNHKKTKTPFQMTYTIGMVWPRQFIGLAWGCQYI